MISKLHAQVQKQHISCRINNLKFSRQDNLINYISKKSTKNNRKDYYSYNYRRINASKTGIVIVDHGSRKEASNKLVCDIADLYQLKNPDKIVEAAHMVLAPPSIKEAINNCYEKGAKKIVVAPFFLGKGEHAETDIPKLVKEAEKSYNDIKCIVSGPLGLDPALIEIIMKRVDEALIIS